MTTDQLAKLASLRQELSGIVSNLSHERLCNLYAILKDTDAQTVMLAGNTEGLAYFASMLLDLAVTRKPGNHFHFDTGCVLDDADRNLILEYREESQAAV